MNSFNLNRFGKTLRWYVSAKSRQLMMWAVGIFVVTFIWEIHQQYNYHYSTTIEYTEGVHQIQESHTFEFSTPPVILLIAFIGISTSMTAFNKKTFRSSFLMLPASNLEKYLSLLAYVLFILPICMFAAYALGDTLRMAVWAWLYDTTWLSGIPDILPSLGFDFSDPLWLPLLVLNILVIVWIFSLYVLGATWLRRFSFVVSSIVVILSVAAFWQFQESLGLSMYYVKQVDGRIVYQGLGSRVYALFILLPLPTALNYWASYRIFKGFQLVTNKWMNYDIFKR